MGWLILTALVWGFVGAFLGAYVCKQKGRKQEEGILIGFLFGLIGVLIVACLPNIEAKERSGRAWDRSPSIPNDVDTYGTLKEYEESECFDQEVMDYLEPNDHSVKKDS